MCSAKNQNLNYRNQVLVVVFKRGKDMLRVYIRILSGDPSIPFYLALCSTYQSNNSYNRKLTVWKTLKIFFQNSLLILIMGMFLFFFLSHPVSKMLHIDKFRISYLAGNTVPSFLLAASRSIWAEKQCVISPTSRALLISVLTRMKYLS